MRFFYAILLFVLALSPVQAGNWYLNGKGPDLPYQLWAYGDDGIPLANAPVVPVSGDVQNIAWPSAVQEGSTVRLYASVYKDQWDEIRLFTSPDGLTFEEQGVVFAANDREPYGIGPAYVMRDPDGPDSYVMYYLVRGPSGPGRSIAVATSPDGITWTRKGAVISPSLPQDAGGLSMSYACRTTSGEVVLVFHGYDETLEKGVSLTAIAATPTSAFGDKTIIKSWDGFSTSFSGYAGQDTGLVEPNSTIPLGIPLLISGASRESIVAVKQEGARVWFDRPLEFTHLDDALYSMARNKVEMSYIKELPDGSWRGIVTLYGPEARLEAEYTAALSSPKLEGPWEYDGKGLRFHPLLPGTLYSLENPTPLVSTAACSN